MDRKKTTLYIENDLYIKVKCYCALNSISMKKFIDDAISEKLHKIEKEG